jgi:hypothetical protein
MFRPFVWGKAWKSNRGGNWNLSIASAWRRRVVRVYACAIGRSVAGVSCLSLMCRRRTWRACSVASRKSPREIDMRIPVRDCMTEGRMTTHGWGACTSVEGTRAPSTGDAIERTRDSTRPPWEKSSLGQNRVTLYFTFGLPTLAKRPKWSSRKGGVKAYT